MIPQTEVVDDACPKQPFESAHHDTADQQSGQVEGHILEQTYSAPGADGKGDPLQRGKSDNQLSNVSRNSNPDL